MDDLVTFITSSVEIHTPTVGVVFAAILVCLLLYVSGFASGSEIAFFSLSPNDIEELDPQVRQTRIFKCFETIVNVHWPLF